jgi:hypothetical protein
MSGRLLVATGAAVADVDALPPLVRRLLDAASDVLVITPILPGGLPWLGLHWRTTTGRGER